MLTPLSLPHTRSNAVSPRFNAAQHAAMQATRDLNTAHMCYVDFRVNVRVSTSGGWSVSKVNSALEKALCQGEFDAFATEARQASIYIWDAKNTIRSRHDRPSRPHEESDVVRRLTRIVASKVYTPTMIAHLVSGVGSTSDVAKKVSARLDRRLDKRAADRVDALIRPHLPEMEGKVAEMATVTPLETEEARTYGTQQPYRFATRPQRKCRGISTEYVPYLFHDCCRPVNKHGIIAAMENEDGGGKITHLYHKECSTSKHDWDEDARCPQCAKAEVKAKEVAAKFRKYSDPSTWGKGTAMGDMSAKQIERSRLKAVSPSYSNRRAHSHS